MQVNFLRGGGGGEFSRAELLLRKLDGGDKAPVEGDPDARSAGDRHEALAGFEGLVDDVLGPVAAAGAGIARLGEIGQGSQVDIVGPPDPAFQHPAAPDRRAGRLGGIVDPAGFGQPAHPPDLEVDHPAGPDLEGFAGIGSREDRFIQAQGGAQLGLQPGVVDDVVVSQGLLDVIQVESIQLAAGAGRSSRL